MSNVNYELPEQLGTLAFNVPSTWDGARAKGVDAAWIDQKSIGFKENVTLKIHTIEKANNPEEVLDQYVEKLVVDTAITPTSSVVKTPLRREFSVKNKIEGHALALSQDQTILYTENKSNAYLVCLSSTRLELNSRVDLSTAQIVS